MTVRKRVFVYLGFDLDFGDAGPLIEPINLYLVVEMTDVADDGLILHGVHVFGGDDVFVSGGGDIDIRCGQRVLDPADGISRHAGLQGTDRVDLRDQDAAFLSGK